MAKSKNHTNQNQKCVAIPPALRFFVFAGGSCASGGGGARRQKRRPKRPSLCVVAACFRTPLIHSFPSRSYKAHRNGIKRMKKPKQLGTQGMDPKFIKNQR